MPPGISPTVTVAGGRPHPSTTEPLQVRPSITATFGAPRSLT